MSDSHNDNSDGNTSIGVSHSRQDGPNGQDRALSIDELQTEQMTDQVISPQGEPPTEQAVESAPADMPESRGRSDTDATIVVVSEPQSRLSADELAALEDMAGGSDARSRRARIILDWDSGLEAATIAGGVRLSTNTVMRTIKEFEARRLASLAAAQPGSTRRTRKPAPDTGSTGEQTNRITVEELCREYDVDMKHGMHVAELAHQLLALTMPLHRLDEHYLDVIYVAGLLHNIAYSIDPKKHHTRGRDILLTTPLSNVSDADRAVIAAVTAFHRKPWAQERLEREKSYVSLPGPVQPVALWLAAVLRIVDGLDYSQSQSTSLTESMIGKEICLLGVKGPHDKMDRSRANAKADMWRSISGIALKVGSRKDVKQAMRRRVARRPDPSAILPGDSMAEAGRTILHFHLQRMLYNEPGVRSGTHAEAVHDMRVAVRRMSSAVDVFGGNYKGKTRRSIQRELQTLEDVLGGVRDLDVNIEQAHTYLETLPADARPDLEQLIADWKDEREPNRVRLLRYLDSQRYAEFAERFLEFGETPGANVAKSVNDAAPIAVAHAAPAIIYIRYEAVRAYEPVIQEAPIETFHDLRAEAKRMRYALEFFRDVLGPESRDLVALLIRVQDHLGALQDADIASVLIHKYIRREVKKAHRVSGDTEPVDISTRLYGINAYLDSRQDQIETARKTFGPLWAEVISPETRQMLARAVGIL